MNPSHGLLQQQSLKLNITPQLKQSIYLLQISAEELTDYLQRQAEENPLLDIRWPLKTYDAESSQQSRFLTPRESLEMMLLSQLRVSGITGKLYRIAQFMAGNLNEDGYFMIPLEEVCRACHADMGEVRTTLASLQSLEPPGVGARSLRECLLLQIARDSNADRWAGAIVRDHLNELGGNKLKAIADKLHIDVEAVKKAVQYIRGLNPRPGLLYGTGSASPVYIEADALIRKDENEYTIVMNDSHIPKVSVNTEYRLILSSDESGDARRYLQHHFKAAKSLLRGLSRRETTLYRVIETIIKEQRDFLDHGSLFLKPLVLKNVAQKLGMHESTVSRAVQNKYVQTPQGLYELKFFFSSGLAKSGDKEISPESIKAKIRSLIDNENKRKPLSDQNITDILVGEGIHISRRTVMKYREEMLLLSSRMRHSG